MDTGHPCRHNLPTIVQLFCNEAEIINNKRKLQAGLQKTAGWAAQANYTVVPKRPKCFAPPLFRFPHGNKTAPLEN